MHRARGLIRTAAALAVAALALPAAAAERRPITETDLFRFVWVADPRISPDGKRVAFVRVTVNAKKEGYDTAVWMVPTDAGEPARVFTAGPRDSSPRWSPDGKTLAFLRSATEGRQAGAAAAPRDPAGGGEARASPTCRGGRAHPSGRPTAEPSPSRPRTPTRGPREDQAKSKEATGRTRRRTRSDRESDVRVITRSVYRFDGAGYIDRTRPGHLWAVDVPAEGQPAASRSRSRAASSTRTTRPSRPTASRIFFLTQPVEGPLARPPRHRPLSRCRGEGGETRREASIDGAHGGLRALRRRQPGGLRRLLNPKPSRSFDQPDLFVADLPGGTARNLTAAFDADVDGGIIGDQRAPRGGLPTPAGLEPRPAVRDRQGGRAGPGQPAQVRRRHGNGERLTTGDQDVLGYSAAADASALAVVVSTPTSMGDLLLLDGARRPDAAALPAQPGAVGRARPHARPRSSTTRASTGGRSRPGSRSRPTTWPGSATR